MNNLEQRNEDQKNSEELFANKEKEADLQFKPDSSAQVIADLTKENTKEKTQTIEETGIENEETKVT